MSGEPRSAEPWPTEIKVRRAAKMLEVSFDTGERFEIPAELLRVMTPAADERGHTGFALTPLPIEKPGVGIRELSPIGRYAVRIVFDDGHDTGLYTWEALHRIGRDRARLEAEHRKLISGGSGAPH
jgi:DUF971 family protein